MLRGSRDFEDRADYERFLRELFAQRNSGRTERFAEDRPLLKTSPRGGWTPGSDAGCESPRGARSASAPTPTRCPAD